MRPDAGFSDPAGDATMAGEAPLALTTAQHTPGTDSTDTTNNSTTRTWHLTVISLQETRSQEPALR